MKKRKRGNEGRRKRVNKKDVKGAISTTDESLRRDRQTDRNVDSKVDRHTPTHTDTDRHRGSQM